jgi:hypothetical protein
MKKILIIGCIGLGLVMTGCSHRTAPVSLHTESVTTIDSTHTKKEVLKDSSYYKETVEEKTLPPATVGITLTKSQLDSLIVALQGLPSTVSRSVTYQDPKTRAMLTVLLDSLGRIKLSCTATEQKYFEIVKQSSRTIASLEKELQSYRDIEKFSSVEVRKPELTWWQKFKRNTFLVICVVLVCVAMVLGVLSKFRII